MPLGTKNRQIQTANLCKQHLREKHHDKLRLGEEYIVEMNGNNHDVSNWGRSLPEWEEGRNAEEAGPEVGEAVGRKTS